MPHVAPSGMVACSHSPLIPEERAVLAPPYAEPSLFDNGHEAHLGTRPAEAEIREQILKDH